MTDRTLAVVASRARKAREAVAFRNAAILAAHEAGHSLRTIAEAAGVSHQTVKNLLAVTSREMGTKG